MASHKVPEYQFYGLALVPYIAGAHCPLAIWLVALKNSKIYACLYLFILVYFFSLTKDQTRLDSVFFSFRLALFLFIF